MTLNTISKLLGKPKTKRFPSLFVGHGSPMNAIENNLYTQQMQRLGKALQTPEAIVMISAHWQTTGSYVTAAAQPPQIFDFSGFPEKLSQHRYSPPGSPETAASIHQLHTDIQETSDWGLDHGSWSVLTHLFPDPKIPVLQLSLNRNLQVQDILKLMEALQELRSRGILFIGSGNLVHNLREISWQPDSAAFPWAKAFEEKSLGILASESGSQLEKMNQILQLSEFKFAHPTPEHFIPLIYNLGLLNSDEQLRPVYTGIQNGSISMATLISESLG